jgi:DNA-binding NarL/FixJ family response regulator
VGTTPIHTVVLCTHRAASGQLLEAWISSRLRLKVRTVETPNEALPLAKAGTIVLVELGYAHEDVFRMAETLAKRAAPVPVVFLAGEAPLGWVQRALGAEAAGFLGKCATLEDLQRAIHAIRHGQRYFSPCVARAVTEVAIGRSGVSALTARELQVLKLLCDGQSTKEIATRVRLEPKTIEFIRSKLMQKTKTRCAAELVKFACAERLIEVRSPSEPEIAPGPGNPYHRHEGLPRRRARGNRG